FILYVLGYLTIRFHLTVLGAGTDLSIVDERYLFAGARFVVYLVSACVTLLLLLLLPAAIAWAAWRFLWRRGKRQGEAAPARPLSRDTRFNQTALLLLGIVLAILVIQVLMKKCFFFANLLLQPNLPPEAQWLFALAAGKDDALLALFFVGLVASVAI